MKEFTQDELENAYKQMQEEREAEYNTAKKVAKDLENLLGIERGCSIDAPYGYERNRVTPYPIPFVLKLIYQTYGPYLEDFVKKLNKMENVKPSEGVVGFYIGEPTFEIKVQEGTYKIVFEYFDNHSCGW